MGEREGTSFDERDSALQLGPFYDEKTCGIEGTESMNVMAPFAIKGEPLKDLEDKFEKTINSFLVEERLDSLVYDASEQSELTYVYKKKGIRQIQSDSAGTRITLPSIIHQEVTPKRMRFEIATSGWLESSDPVRNHLLRELAHEIAWAETRVIVESLLKAGKEFRTKAKGISGAAIVEAYDWIRSNENTPDTLIVHPFEEARLMESKEFLNAYSFPELWRKSAGNHFSGVIGGTNVYWTPALSEHTVLLYEKMETRLWRTPLKVEFDNLNKMPSRLYLGEECFAWAIDDNAVAKIVLEK